MKKIMLMAIAAIIFTAGSEAQVQRKFDSTQNVQKRMKHRSADRQNWQGLNLTEAQKTQMKQNQEAFKVQRETVRNDASLSADQKKAKMQEIQKTSREKTNSLLTTEQKATLKDKAKKQHQGGKHENFDRKELDLTADQQAKMKDMRSNMKKEMEGIKSNTSINQAEKKEQMKNIQIKYRDQMSQVLTPEQKLKMKNHQGKMKNKGMKRNK